MQNLLQKNSSETLVIPAHPPAKKESPKNILESKYTQIKTSPVVAQHHAKKAMPSVKFMLPGHLHLLFFGIVCYLITAYIFLKVHPTQIAHILFPNLYLPLLTIFFISNFCFFSFLLRRARRGFLIATVLSLYLFLLLQHVFSPALAAGIAVPFILYEVAMSLL